MLRLFLVTALSVLALFGVVLLLLPSRRPSNRSRPQRQNLQTLGSAKANAPAPVSVTVLVLGDIGRSPRMQYHALSIAKHGGSVDLVGYLDSEPLPSLLEDPRVSIVPLPGTPRALQTANKMLFLFLAPLKVIFQIWILWCVLGYRTRAANWMLVQNPPSIPTLAIAVLVCFLRNTRLIIDWHNFGYSILALKLGSSHPLVKVSKIYEVLLARVASTHFAVTNAMAHELRAKFALSSPIMTLHDRPAPLFQPLSAQERSEFVLTHFVVADHSESIFEGKTRLLVSSTSWTVDEDFSILIDALCKYSERCSHSRQKMPDLLVVITGKGPQKDHYVRQINELQMARKLEMVKIKTAWLNFDDYARLLGAADLGISLHTSSSGVDLPMKVVDMFGAGLPVAGWSNFKAWSELVTEDVNGRGFSSAEQLTDILLELFKPDSPHLARLRQGAIQESKRRWEDEWDSVARPLFW